MATSSAAFKASAWLRTGWHHFRLDMTPMVGLAFLLLTFFLLHAGMAKPRVLQLTMPADDKASSRYFGCFGGGISGTVTIVLGENH